MKLNIALTVMAMAMPLNLQAESLEELSSKNAAALSQVQGQIETGKEAADVYCAQIALKMDYLTMGAYAGKRTLETVAKVLEEKAADLRRARSREVLIGRREAIDTFHSFSKVLRSGEEVLSASAGLAERLLAQLGPDSSCEKARDLASSSFKYLPDALTAPKRIASTAAGVFDRHIVKLSYARSEEVLIDAPETAKTFSDLASSLRIGAKTLEAALGAVEDARAKLGLPLVSSPQPEPAQL